MRLKAGVTEARTAFLQDLFAAEPGLTVRGAQDRLRARFGQGMYPMSILRIRTAVRVALTSGPAPTTIAALPPKGKS